MLLTVMMLLHSVTAGAQYVEGASDPWVEGEMIAAYGVQGAVDNTTLKEYQKIAKNYGASLLSTIAIAGQKARERQAMRKAGLLSDARQNIYYVRMLEMAPEIAKETYYCTALLARKPENILYWAPTIYEITSQSLSLYAQFQTMVCNNKLKFPYEIFPVISKKIQKYANLGKALAHGNVDWKSTIDDLAEFDFKQTADSMFSKEIFNLGNVGAALATMGTQWAMSRLGMSDAVNLDYIIGDSKLMDAFKLKFDEVRNVRNMIMDAVGYVEDPKRLKMLARDAASIYIDGVNVKIENILSGAAGFDADSYMSTVMKGLDDQYYRQHYRIIIRNLGSKTVCDYVPKKGNTTSGTGNYDFGNSTWEANGWVCHRSGERKKKESWEKDYSNATFSSSERAEALNNAEVLSGWSREKVNSLNGRNDGSSYNLTYNEVTYTRYERTSSGRWRRHDYLSYTINVVHTWSKDRIYWEKDLDTQSQDPEIFQQEVQQRMQQAQFEADEEGNEEGTTSVILETSPVRYYQVPSDEQIAKAQAVSFVVNCDNHSDMGHENVSWKENSHLAGGGTLTGKGLEQMKLIAMDTRVSDEGDPYQEVENLENSLHKKLNSLNNRINELKKKKETATGNEGGYLENEIAELENQQTSLNHKLDSCTWVRQEIAEDMAEESDVRRIPAVKRELTARFGIVFEDDGLWDGPVYTEHAKMKGQNGVITFQATLKINRKEEYWLGIRVHRARCCIEWKLSGDQSSSEIVSTMRLDTTNTKEYNKKLVENEQKKIMDDYPDCSVEVKYASPDSIADPGDNSTLHMMWVSDRIALARNLYNRVVGIYVGLKQLHSYLDANLSVEDFFKREVLERITQKMRERIAGECLKSWIQSSASVMSRSTGGGSAFNEAGGLRDYKGNAGLKNL